MGLPTHPSTTVKARLQRAWAKAHKNSNAGVPAISEAAALAGHNDTYAVGGHQDVTHEDDGTVDRAIDATVTDRAARDSGQRGYS